MKCYKCQSKLLQVTISGHRIKLLCANCFTYQKFISTSELKLLRRCQSIPEVIIKKEPKREKEEYLTRKQIIDLIREELKNYRPKRLRRTKEKDIPF